MSKTARPDAFSYVQQGVGARIRWVRELAIPNRSEAARLLGVDPSTLAKIEDGTRAPSIFNVIEIANRFRVSTDFLLRGLLVARTDEQLALHLAAQHPELVRQLEGTFQNRDTGQAGGR
jgi:transcriptional regulator with XRE-family HTH domain